MKKNRINIIVILIFLLIIPGIVYGAKDYNRIVKYDTHFSKYSKRFFGPAFNWHFFKAQAIAESNLNPLARSPAGALGIMQIMPKTFKEISNMEKSISSRIKNARWNIAAGIYYDRMMWKIWKAKRPFLDRVNFMFASYNAGKGNILKAQKLAEKKGLNPNLWQSIKKVLPKITGKRSRETISYIKKINSLKKELR